MLSLFNIFIISILTASIFISSVGLNTLPTALSQEQESKRQQQQVTLRIMLDDQGDPPRLLKMLFGPALKELQAKHPDLDIKLDYRPIPYLDYDSGVLRRQLNLLKI
jgi:hypothetical protein